MKLLTDELTEKLLENGRNADQDHAPVVKFFVPAGSATWLVSELVPDNQDIAFGLCDLGMGFPELGYLSISELESLRIRPFNMPAVERDLYFEPQYPLSVYTEAARICERITEDPDALQIVAQTLGKSRLDGPK